MPVADFSMDKGTYSVGEKVKLTNKSKDAHTYKWIFPDGQTSVSFNVNYKLNSNTPPGVHSVILEAISKDGKRKSSAVKKFSVM